MLALLGLAWLCGVIAAATGISTIWPLLAATGAGAVLGLTIAGRRPSTMLAFAMTLVALVAIWRYEDARPSSQPYGIAEFNEGAAVRLSGTVVSDPEAVGRSQRFTVRADTLQHDGLDQRTTGSVLVTTRAFPRFAYGDRLVLEGELTTPPSFEDFDYREYLARRGVISLASFPRLERTGAGGGSAIVRALGSLRRPLSGALSRALPEPESALARGILLGERAAIPRDLTDDLNKAGISHLVAISGYNVMLVAGLSLAALSWLIGRRWAVVVSMLLVVVFALFVGGSASVLRATVMAIVMLGAVLAGRPGSGWRALLITAAVLTLYTPLIIDDVGFQLSAAATAGIVVISPRLQDVLTPAISRRLPGGLAAFISESSAVTTSASLAVLPVMAAAFGRISVVALLSNLLAGFMFPIILATSAATALVGAFSSDLGSVFGSVAYWPLWYLVEVGRGFAALPATIALRVTALGFVGLYVALGVLTFFILPRLRHIDDEDADLPQRPSPWRLSAPVVASFVLVAVGGFSLASAALGHSDRLVVSILDIGQGDAILIETPAGQRILIDGGPSGDRLMQALGRELPSDAHAFDLVVLTHGQDDHVTGLVTVLERYDVAQALVSPLPGSTAAYRAWTELLQERRVPVHVAISGEWLDLGDDVHLEVLGPPPELLRGTTDDLNNNCVVTRLVFRDISFLLACDLESEGEAALLRSASDLRSTVLKVGHHGSDGSTTPSFLAAVHPAYAAISVGAENTYGHPSPSTRLRLQDVPLARTDLNGRLRFETDGRGLWADLERGDFQLVRLK